jgi:hypothetical protein
MSELSKRWLVMVGQGTYYQRFTITGTLTKFNDGTFHILGDDGLENWFGPGTTVYIVEAAADRRLESESRENMGLTRM